MDATDDQIYTAIRNADKAGDTAAVQKLGAYLKSRQAAAPASAGGQGAKPEPAAAPQDKPGILSTVGDVGETLGSGMVAPVVAGLAGVAQGGMNLARQAVGAQPGMSAADRVEQVEGALTHQPVTVGGQAYTEAITYPLRKLAEGADYAGGKVTDATGSPALGTLANTAIQMAPSVIDPALRGRAKVPVTAGAQPAQTAAAAAARAETYARTRLGVDWNSLSQNFKDTLTSIATDSKRLDALPVDAVKRQAQLQSLRVPVSTTAGKLTRDPVALRNEANVAATNAGKPIRDSDVQANRDLRANVEGLRQSVGGQGASRATAGAEGGVAEEVGRNVQTPLRTKQTVSEANYNSLYKKARQTEPNARVSPDAMYDFVRGNPEVLNPAVQHLEWLRGWLKKAGIEKEDAEGNVTRRPIRLEELDDLRKKAGSLARGGGDNAHYAGEVIKAIDKSFDEVPAAAKAWKQARDAFKAHKNEFEETSAVERLVSDKSRNDPKTALEDTWKKSVQTAKIQEIRDLKKSLLGGGNAETRLAGKKALRELKQETVNQYFNYITRKTATNELGETQITAAQMVEGLKHIGGEARVREILGNRAANELKRIIEAAKVVKTEPSIRNAGSSTLQNLLAFGEKFLDKVPVVGDVASGAIKVVGAVKKAGESGRIARQAVRQPTDEAAARAGKDKVSEERRKKLGAAARRVAPSAAAGAGSLSLQDDPRYGASP